MGKAKQDDADQDSEDVSVDVDVDGVSRRGDKRHAFNNVSSLSVFRPTFGKGFGIF